MPKTSLLYISSLIAYVAFIVSVASVALEVNVIPLAIFSLCLISGFILDRRSIFKPLVKPSFLFMLVILGIIISFMGINSENLFNRMLGILLIVISAKLISPKRSRDLLQLYLLNFFCCGRLGSNKAGLGIRSIGNRGDFFVRTGPGSCLWI